MVCNTLNSFRLRGSWRKSGSVSAALLEQLLDAHVLLRVLLHDLRHRHLKVLLGHVHSPLSERIHACKGSVQISNMCAQENVRAYIFLTTQSQDWPASVQVPFTSAPELPPICSAIFLKFIPLKFVFVFAYLHIQVYPPEIALVLAYLRICIYKFIPLKSHLYFVFAYLHNIYVQQVSSPCQVHFSWVNFEDVKTCVLIRRWEFNFSE